MLSICLIFIDCYGKKNDDFIQAKHSHYSKQSSIQNKLDAFSLIFAYSCIIASQQTFVLKGAWHTLVGEGQEKLLAYCYLSLSSHIKCRLLVFSDILSIIN